MRDSAIPPPQPDPPATHGAPALGAGWTDIAGYTREQRAQVRADAATSLARASHLVARAEAEQARSVELQQQAEAVREIAQEAVTALARLERAEGSPPERVVVLVKSMVQQSEGWRSLDPDLARQFEADVVRWGIEAYYAA